MTLEEIVRKKSYSIIIGVLQILIDETKKKKIDSIPLKILEKLVAEYKKELKNES